MKHDLLYSGAAADIRVCVGNRGNAPAVDFLEGLPVVEGAKMVRLIEEFANRGEIRNTERFRAEDQGIYALKSGKVRIFCFFLEGAPRKTLVLTHGYKKASRRIPRGEFLRALRIYRETIGR